MSTELETQKALCHPTRKRVTSDGWCAACLIRRTNQATPAALQSKDVRLALRELHKNVEHVKELGEEAQAILEAGLPDYAALHMEAARNAAAKGDARPAEWALQNVTAAGKRLVQPAEKAAGPDNSVKVFVGVKVHGLPTPEDQAVIVEAVKGEDG